VVINDPRSAPNPRRKPEAPAPKSRSQVKRHRRWLEEADLQAVPVGKGKQMSPATITALAAIFGSVSGALASSVGSWITQRPPEPARSAGEEDLSTRTVVFRLHQREYSHSGGFLEHNLNDGNRLIPAYAVSRMRLSSSEVLLASAEEIRSRAIRGEDR